MQRCPQGGRAHRRLKYVVQHLGRWAHNDDLVSKKLAPGVVREPEFWVKYFVKRPWFEGIHRRKADQMAVKILRDVARSTNLSQRPGTERFVNFLAGPGGKPASSRSVTRYV